MGSVEQISKADASRATSPTSQPPRFTTQGSRRVPYRLRQGRPTCASLIGRGQPLRAPPPTRNSLPVSSPNRRNRSRLRSSSAPSRRPAPGTPARRRLGPRPPCRAGRGRAHPCSSFPGSPDGASMEIGRCRRGRRRPDATRPARVMRNRRRIRRCGPTTRPRSRVPDGSVLVRLGRRRTAVDGQPTRLDGRLRRSPALTPGRASGVLATPPTRRASRPRHRLIVRRSTLPRQRRAPALRWQAHPGPVPAEHRAPAAAVATEEGIARAAQGLSVSSPRPGPDSAGTGPFFRPGTQVYIIFVIRS